MHGWTALRQVVILKFCKGVVARSYMKTMVCSLNDEVEEAVKKLKIERFADPPKLSLLPNDAVLIKVASVAVHWVDLLMMAGQYQHAPPIPYTPGMEYSGEVVAVNPDATDIQIGEKVYVDIFNAGPRSYGDYQQFGGMASFSVAPRQAVHRIPAGLNMHQAASYCGAYETAYHALVHCAGVQEGETVLIHGATGSGGVAATQVCSALGADVIATGGSDEKLELVRENGCLGSGKILNVHNYNSKNSLRDLVKRSSPHGVDVVYDTVGGEKLGVESLRCLRFGGRYCIIGWTSTPFAAGGRGSGSNQSTANTLPTNLIMMKGARVIGCPVAIHTHHDPSIRPTRLSHLNGMLSKELISPFVSHVYPLHEVRTALLAKWQRKVTGSCVLNCS